jgi:hypothetical protein
MVAGAARPVRAGGDGSSWRSWEQLAELGADHGWEGAGSSPGCWRRELGWAAGTRDGRRFTGGRGCRGPGQDARLAARQRVPLSGDKQSCGACWGSACAQSGITHVRQTCRVAHGAVFQGRRRLPCSAEWCVRAGVPRGSPSRRAVTTLRPRAPACHPCRLIRASLAEHLPAASQLQHLPRARKRNPQRRQSPSPWKSSRAARHSVRNTPRSAHHITTPSLSQAYITSFRRTPSVGAAALPASWRAPRGG